MKRIALGLAALLSILYRIIPFAIRRRIVMGFAVLESRIGAPSDSLRRLYTIEDSLELVINERAMALGGGEHPKHRLTDYHGFFADPGGSRAIGSSISDAAMVRSPDPSRTIVSRRL